MDGGSFPYSGLKSGGSYNMMFVITEAVSSSDKSDPNNIQEYTMKFGNSINRSVLE